MARKKVLLIAASGYRFVYPQIPDAAELLSRAGHSVVSIIPKDTEVMAWNAGRGFEIKATNNIRSKIRGVGAIWYMLQSIPEVLKADVVIGSCTTELPLLLLANILPNKKAIYHMSELAIPSIRGNGGYAWLQYILPYTGIEIFTTGTQRSRILKALVGLATVPKEINLGALRVTKAISRPPESTFAERIRQKAGRPNAIVALCSGGLDPLCGFDLLLEAAIPAESGVLIGMVGRLSTDMAKMVAEAHATTGNYFYLGELGGSRYDLIANLRGADLGFAMKKMDHSQIMGDRLYTPTKLFDFIAAGVPVLCSRQSTLGFVKRRGVGLVLSEWSASAIRDVLLSLPARRGELAEMAKAAREGFDNDLNFEAAAQPLVEAVER